MDGISGSIVNSEYDEAEEHKQPDILIKLDGTVHAGSSLQDIINDEVDEDEEQFQLDESSLLLTTGQLQTGSALIDLEYVSSVKSKKEWDHWDKYISRMSASDKEQATSSDAPVPSSGSTPSKLRRWTVVDRQFFEQTCIPYYSEDFFAKETMDLIKEKYKLYFIQ